VSPRKLKGEDRDLINYVSLRFFYVAADIGGTGGDVIGVAIKKLWSESIADNTYTDYLH
jgi:hypothetical protein